LKPVRKKTSTKAAVPLSRSSSLLKKKQMQKKNSVYESSDSEGTKALKEEYEREPQNFIKIGSENF
jgi:hypothetical protein